MSLLPELITVDCYACAGDSVVETENGSYYVCEFCNDTGLQDVCRGCLETPDVFSDGCACNQVVLNVA